LKEIELSENIRENVKLLTFHAGYEQGIDEYMT